MARRCLVLSLIGLLLVALATGWLSCKQEEGESRSGEAALEEPTTPSAEEPAEEGVKKDTVLFEEEEGVQQEADPHIDY